MDWWCNPINWYQERRFFDHIAYYCSSVYFNKFVWSRLCNKFEPICIYGDWIIHWLMNDWFGQDAIFDEFLCIQIFEIVFFGILNEHVDIFSWISIFSCFWKFKFFFYLIKNIFFLGTNYCRRRRQCAAPPRIADTALVAAAMRTNARRYQAQRTTATGGGQTPFLAFPATWPFLFFCK